MKQLSLGPSLVGMHATRYSRPSMHATRGVLIQWNGGMEWNGMSAALTVLLTHVQPTHSTASTSHLVTMIAKLW